MIDPPKKLNKATIFFCIREEIVGCCNDIIKLSFSSVLDIS